jgi:hypothetical protein
LIIVSVGDNIFFLYCVYFDFLLLLTFKGYLLLSMIKVSYLLLDAARMENEMDVAVAFPNENSCLYEGKSKIELAGVGPYLFKTDNNSELNNWVKQEGWGNSWGVALFTFIPFPELHKHCRKFLLVRTEDNMELYFRFYDPRVLRIFLPTCSKEQLQNFFGPIQYFIVEDEDPEFALKFWLENYQLRSIRFPASEYLQNEESDLIAHTPEIVKTYHKTEYTKTGLKESSISQPETSKKESPPTPPKRNTSQWKDFFFE